MTRYVNDEQESVVEVWPMSLGENVQLRKPDNANGPVLNAGDASRVLHFLGYHRDDAGDT